MFSASRPTPHSAAVAGMAACSAADEEKGALVLGDETSQNGLASGNKQKCDNVAPPRASPTASPRTSPTASPTASPMASPATRLRQAPGGNSSLSLGEELPESRFSHCEGQGQDASACMSLEAKLRFPCAPGGNATVVLGQDEESIVGSLTEKVTSNSFANGASQNVGNVLTERPTVRLHQAPGGKSTLVLGDDAFTPVPAASGRVAPGGESTIALGFDGEEAAPAIATTRTAPGGQATVLLGAEASEARFDHCRRLEGADVPGVNLEPTPRFVCGPGGQATVVLGDGQEMVSSTVTGKVTSTARPSVENYSLEEGCRAPGGKSTLVLGGDGPAELPVKSTARIAPGGKSSLVLGGDALEDEAAPVRTGRTAPGGEATIQLTDEVPPCTAAPDTGTRMAPGGESSILLGDGTSADRFRHRQDIDAGNASAPDPTPRFSCAPGGTATIVLGGDADPTPVPVAPTGAAVGGESTVLLGSEAAADRFAHRQGDNQVTAATTEPAPRFPCAPGGTATIVLGESDAQPTPAPVTRTGPGGESSIVLGSDDSADRFLQRQGDEASCGAVPDPTARFPYAPGGPSTINFSGSDQVDATVTRTSIGGESTLVLGGGDFDIADRFAHRQGIGIDVESTSLPEPLPRFPCAPGGNATISIGGEPLDNLPVIAKTAPGGESTLVLGGDNFDTKDRFSHGGDIEAVNACPLEPAGRSSSCALTSGESSSFAFGGEAPAANPPTSTRTAPGGESTVLLGSDASADRFSHCLADASAGDPVSVPEPLSRFCCAPGGTSTVSLRGDIQINTTISDRTAPGGESTVLLGSDASAERFSHLQAESAEPASVPEPATRFSCAPGGDSTLSLGGGEAPSDLSTSLTQRPVGGPTTLRLGGEADPPAPRRRAAMVPPPDEENVAKVANMQPEVSAGPGELKVKPQVVGFLSQANGDAAVERPILLS